MTAVHLLCRPLKVNSHTWTKHKQTIIPLCTTTSPKDYTYMSHKLHPYCDNSAVFYCFLWVLLQIVCYCISFHVCDSILAVFLNFFVVLLDLSEGNKIFVHACSFGGKRSLNLFWYQHMTIYKVSSNRKYPDFKITAAAVSWKLPSVSYKHNSQDPSTKCMIITADKEREKSICWQSGVKKIFLT